MRLFLTCLLLPVALCACSTTKTAAPDSEDVAAVDAVDDTGPADVSQADTAVDAAADVSPLGPPTWTGIYADYFAPTGLASCGGSGCHTSVDQPAYMVAKFICPDKQMCYTSVTGTSKLVLATDVANPAKSKLMRNLRQVGNAGKMPSGSKFVFSTADVDRIATWISNGAKND